LDEEIAALLAAAPGLEMTSLRLPILQTGGCRYDRLNVQLPLCRFGPSNVEVATK